MIPGISLILKELRRLTNGKPIFAMQVGDVKPPKRIGDYQTLLDSAQTELAELKAYNAALLDTCQNLGHTPTVPTCADHAEHMPVPLVSFRSEDITGRPPTINTDLYRNF